MTVTEAEIDSTEPDAGAAAEAGTGDEAVGEILDDVLVEEISIDGMCGVY